MYCIKTSAVLASLLLLNVQHVKMQELSISLMYIHIHPPFKFHPADETEKQKSSLKTDSWWSDVQLMFNSLSGNIRLWRQSMKNKCTV